ncbi:MAG: hypothetical protein CBB98_12430 [Rhodobacteraceae bacterium TMED38]|nr:MAG: hypothetical protein CBB98_12430 [Rhodobacteraceae bacterium TMED38]|tara:strand:+ start:4223 stop:4726 length:504 start_codon:yes stop_codon:yes gene_type:complete
METTLSNYCPHWIISIVTAQSGIDFLSGSSTLTSIAKKYSRGLSEQYDPVNYQYLEGIAEEKLRTLSEIEAAENAVIILNAYVYRRYKFHPDNKPRKITGLFGSEFSGTKVPLSEQREVCKLFKAFIFSIRSNIYNYAPSGWTIIEEPEGQWLGELVAEPSSIFDSF